MMERVKQNLKIVLDFLIESVPEDELPQADGIFVFGHVDPRLAKHAAHLWKLGKAPRVILTGKGRRDIPAGVQTEAEYYAAILKNEGVTEDVLVIEDKSTNTLENVLFGIETCRENGLYPKSLILCSLPPLLRRSIATFGKCFPGIQVWGSAFEICLEEYLPHTQRILAEFSRFEEYAQKGHIMPVFVPEKVAEAIEKIRILGKQGNR